jgi:hypothetical protein
MAQYTFNTKTVFLLGRFLKHFEKNIDEVVALIEASGGVGAGEDIFSKIPAERVLSLIFQVITSASDAEDTAIQLLAVASRRSELEVRNMDGHEFIKEFREFLVSIDWSKLMGESLGLTLSQPELPKEPNPVP